MIRKNEKKCFISAPFGTDLSIVLEVLEENRYQVVAPNDSNEGELWSDVILNEIDSVDLFVSILPEGETVVNAVFELGIAIGKQKEVLIIASPKQKELPFSLSSFQIIKADADNKEAIEFAIKHVKIGDDKGKRKGSKKQNPAILNFKYQDYLEKLENSTGEREIEKIVHDIFLNMNLGVVSDAQIENTHNRPDFAIWDDSFEKYVGNPLIVEVKANIDSEKKLINAIHQVSKYVNSVGSHWGILIYTTRPTNSIFFTKHLGPPNIIAIKLEHLIKELRHRSFQDYIRALRNKRVHGVEG